MKARSAGSRARATGAVASFFVLVALTAACGQPSGDGQVVGARPAQTPSNSDSAFDTTNLAGILDSQLKEVLSSGQIADESAQFQAEFDTILTVRQSERLIALQALGASVIDARLRDIANLRGNVYQSPLTWGERDQVFNLLDGATSTLDAMQVKIANDGLVDEARADIQAVAKLRIYGLVLPQAHMMIVAFDLWQLAGVYRNEQSSLQAQILKMPLGGQTGPAQAAVNDLGYRVGLMSRYSSYGVSILSGLTPAGYPGNRSALVSVRDELAGASSAGSTAAYDVSRAKSLLGIA